MRGAWGGLVSAVVVCVSLPAADAGGTASGASVPPFEALFDPALQPKLTELAWSGDGAVLAGFWTEDGRKSLRAFDSATGRELWTVSSDELSIAANPRSLAGSPLAASVVAAKAVAARAGADPADPPAAAQPSSSSFPSMEVFVSRPGSQDFLLVASGDLFLWTPGGPLVRRLTASPAAEESPAFSPDGARVAFVRDCDLYALDVATGAEVRLTADGAADEILNGKTDWVYWEEIWGRDSEGFWWSPDGTEIAYYRFDERAVPTYPLLDEREVEARVVAQRYPKPGDPNPRVEIRVVEVATRESRVLQLEGPEGSYLARVGWHTDGRALAVQRLNRDQTRLELLFCAPDAPCDTVAEQLEATWVNLNSDLRFLPDSSFLWSDEESGWRDLDRYDAVGRKRVDLLPEGWALDRVVEVVEPAGEVIVIAFRTSAFGATERQVLALNLSARGEPRILGRAGAWNDAEVAPGGAWWLHSWNEPGRPTQRALRRLDGGEIAALAGGGELPTTLAALPAPAALEIPGPDGTTLPARWIRPADFDPAKSYPVVMFHYGGPASQVVTTRWEGSRGLWHRWLAARGYVVLWVDNPASIFFGKRGEDRLHRRFGELELAAQRAAVDWLRAEGWADLERLGLWGWSGGGTNTLYAVLHAPGTWRAAVAGAPVTDWRLYDSIWTERYLDSPASNPEGFRDSSPLTAAAALADALLLVHGTGDDNVHPQNTTVLAAALVAAGRPFELALYPGQKHAISGASNRHFYARMTEFFDRHLRRGGR